jgi:lipopolysaccharide transport system permease protein
MQRTLKRLFRLGGTEASPRPKTGRRALKWKIEPERIGVIARVQELWRYRRILWFFATRAIKDRYERMTLGIFWLFARPLMPIVISTLIFGSLIGVPSDGVPYFLFFLTGMSVWRVFERSVLWVTRSLEQQRGLIKKVYFPRIAAPISSVAPALVEYLVLLALLLVTAFVYWWKDGVLYLRPGWPMLAAVGSVIATVVFAIAVGLWTSVLQVRHRDVQYTIRYVMQFWLYITPVIFPMAFAIEKLPPSYGFLLWLNPMAALVETYKWGMLGIGEFPGAALAGSLALIFLVFAGGAVFFTRSEAASVDRL